MTSEENQIYLSNRTILLTNQGLHITPEGFRSIVITAQKIQTGQVIHSVSLELDRLELQLLIEYLNIWENQFHTIKFVENKNE